MQEFMTQHPSFATAAAGAGFVLWFSFVSWFTSLLLGWRSLAQRYRTERQFPEHRRWMQSASMRLGGGINHALTLGSDAEGIYAGMTISIFVGYPRLFIPWTDISVEEPRRWFFFMARRLRLGPDAIPLRVREPLADFLLEPRGGMNAAVNAATPGTISSTF
jgi:hypothetical protein